MTLQNEMTPQKELVPDKTDMGTKVATAGGVLGALAMTSCCILPLVLFSLGVTSAWIGRLGALYQYKWFFFAFAGASLIYGFWKVYKPAGQDCADGAVCARPANKIFMKISLWSATTIIMAALVFPYVTPYFLGY